MSVVSVNLAAAPTRNKATGLLARMFQAICRARMAQAEEIVRLYGYRLSTSVTQPSSETRRTS